jgi:DNA-binding response OmpR family regulator
VNAPLPCSHFCDTGGDGPRFREAGELVLDRAHHDGRVDDRWLDLTPHEFALLWRLAADPGERLCNAQLRAEAWQIALGPADDEVGKHILSVRAKLAGAGAGHLICTDGDDRHFLAAPPPRGLMRLAAG